MLGDEPIGTFRFGSPAKSPRPFSGNCRENAPESTTPDFDDEPTDSMQSTCTLAEHGGIIA
jgi:hypothetical protein